MRVFLTDEEIIELAMDRLDMNCPNPDKMPELAERLDLVYCEDIDMYEDVEGKFMSMCKRIAYQSGIDSKNISHK